MKNGQETNASGAKPKASNINTTAPTTKTTSVPVTVSCKQGPTPTKSNLSDSVTTISLTLPVSTSMPLSLPTTTVAQGNKDLSPSFESDMRVGWVYKLSKATIQQILRDYNQSDEGKADDLRKRLVRLIRNSPSEEARGLPSQPVNEDYSSSAEASSGLEQATYFQPQENTNVVFTTNQALLSTHASYTQQREDLSVREILGLPPTADCRTVKERLVEWQSKNGSRDPSKTFPNKPSCNFGSLALPEYRTFTDKMKTLNFEHVHENTHFQQQPEITNVNREHLARPVTVYNLPDATSLYDANAIRSKHLNTVADVCNQVRKWNLRFDGEHQPVSFIERLNELAESYEIPPALLMKALPELLKGDALLWFRNNKSQWSTYTEFISSFADNYFPPDYRRKLDEEIERRTQGENEPIRKFVVALTTLMRRRGGLSQNDMLNRLFSNMRPDYKLTVRREQFQTTDELIRLSEGYESYLRDRRNFRPPPNPAQSLVHETAYDPRSKLFKPYKVEAVETKPDSSWPNSTRPNYFHDHAMNRNTRDHDRYVYSNRPNSFSQVSKTHADTGSINESPEFRNVRFQNDTQEKPNSSGKSNQNQINKVDNRNNYHRSEIPICWNCGKSGHIFRECKLPKMIRCFNCKKEGVLTTRCPCRAGNVNRDRESRGGPSLVPQAPPQ